MDGRGESVDAVYRENDCDEGIEMTTDTKITDNILGILLIITLFICFSAISLLFTVCGQILYDIITIPITNTTVFPPLFPLNTGGMIGMRVGIVLGIVLGICMGTVVYKTGVPP